jgi:hypothetical protein
VTHNEEIGRLSAVLTGYTRQWKGVYEISHIAFLPRTSVHQNKNIFDAQNI